MTKSSTQIENILPMDDLKESMVNCYSFTELLENQKNNFKSSLDHVSIQKLEYQFSKCKEQIYNTLKGLYDLIEIISFVNTSTQANNKILNKIQKKLDNCTNEDKNNYQLVFDATQKLYNTIIFKLTPPCLSFFSEFINSDLDTHKLPEYLTQLELLSKLCLNCESELRALAEDIDGFIKKTNQLTYITKQLEAEILKT